MPLTLNQCSAVVASIHASLKRRTGRQGNREQSLMLAGLLLVGGVVYTLHFINSYFDNAKQFYLGWGCFVILYLLAQVKATQQQPWRLLLLIFAAFLATRYMLWRTFDTLVFTGTYDLIGMTLVYWAEMYGYLIYMLGLFVNVWPLESAHIPLPEDKQQWPTVDVLIPTYNESDDLIRITATAASQIKYPRDKLRVYILDDGGTQAKRSHDVNGLDAWERHYRLRLMAQELGIGYITREINQQAKAGNINHALQYTDSDLVLILDCDHVPTSDILENTVGHFVADPKLFLVQTPHFFINPAPIEKSLSGIADPSVESDMFYRKIHSSMNFWNASYFCGSAAVLRRSYLMETGGICGTTITEDAETALYLHGRGYNSKYINKPMICGLSPESYHDYVSQHTRWAQGMVQLLVLNNPLTNRGLTIAQRITYFNSCFFWIFSFARFIYFVAPASYLILGMNVYNASWMQILAFTAPHVLGLHVVMNYFYGGTRQPVFSEIYETVQSLFLIPAIISVLLNPWKPKFIVTPKGNLNDQEYLSPVSAPFFLVIAINFTALVLSAMRWFTEPALRDVIMVTGIWCIFNMLMVLLALGAFWEKKQVRKFYRIFAGGSVNVHFPRLGCTLAGEVRDVSATGIGFEIALPFVPLGEEHVTLEVRDSYGEVFHFESKIRRAFPRAATYLCGSEFVTERVSQKEVIAYVFGDSQRWQDVWDRKSRATGTPRMLWYLTKMGVGAIRDSAWSVTLAALRYLYRLAVAWITTSVLRDRLMTLASWCVYYFQLALASLVQLLDKQHKRKLQRNSSSGKADMYFPRVNAWVIGDISDVSLTGIGVFTNVPFAIAPLERVVILPVGKSGESFRFDCQIQRVIQRDGRVLCGAEFMVDVFTYPQIVKFVHGDSRRMMREAPISTKDLSARGKQATASLFNRAKQVVVPVLALLFLNPAAQKKPNKESHD